MVECEFGSWWVSCVVTICDGESLAVWNDDAAFLHTACDDVAACTKPPCKEGPAYDEPFACSTGAAPLVTMADFLVCFCATNLCYFHFWNERGCEQCKTDVYLELASSRHLNGIARMRLAASKGNEDAPESSQ